MLHTTGSDLDLAQREIYSWYKINEVFLLHDSVQSWWQILSQVTSTHSTDVLLGTAHSIKNISILLLRKKKQELYFIVRAVAAQ